MLWKVSEADIAALGHGSPPRAKRVLKAYERQLRDGGDAEGFPCEARELRLCEIFHGGPVSWPPHEPENGLPADPTISLVAVELHFVVGVGGSEPAEERQGGLSMAGRPLGVWLQCEELLPATATPYSWKSARCGPPCMYYG